MYLTPGDNVFNASESKQYLLSSIIKIYIIMIACKDVTVVLQAQA